MKPYISLNNSKLLSNPDSYIDKSKYEHMLFDVLELPKKGVEVYLVRHAQSNMNKNPDLIGGRSDTTMLSLDGINQANRLGNRFVKEGIDFDKIVSSTAIRTFQTTKIISKNIGSVLSDIDLCHLLQELSHGDWEGKDKRKLRTPKIYEKMNKESWDYMSPGGESQREVEHRMRRGITEIVDKVFENNKKKRVLLTSHGLAIKCFLRRMIGLNPENTWKISISNASITKLHYDGNEWRILSINDTDHLK